jgi:hypothetical protein
MKLDEVTELYNAARECVATRYTVECKPVGEFVAEYRRFTSLVAENRDDPYWKAVLRRFARVRYDLTSVPLPPKHPALELVESSKFIEQQLINCGLVFPLLAPPATRLLESMALVAALDENPLGDRVVEVLKAADQKRATVVLYRGTLKAAVEQHFRSRGVEVDVATASHLCGPRIDGSLVLIGPAQWFPSFVLSAPRANTIVLVHYRWIHDEEPAGPLLPDSVHVGCSRRILQGSREIPGDLRAYLVPNPLELLPRIDWTSVASGDAVRPDRQQDPDAVEAYLYALAGMHAVYLEAERDYRIYTVDPHADEETGKVRRESTLEIAPGAYILLRSEGGGDYVRTLADEMLGERANSLRAKQLQWKRALRAKVREQGIESVILRLRLLGCEKASEPNLRYWMSFDTIKTFEFRDFVTIMKFLGSEQLAVTWWPALDEIDKAHKRAGAEIRRRLEEKVVASDLNELESRGWMDFELEKSGGGRLTIFRVEAKSPTPYWIAHSRLRHPFVVERDLWHG